MNCYPERMVDPTAASSPSRWGSRAPSVMCIRKWIKKGGASLIGAFMLLCVAHWILPPPWWWKEAGPPPTLFSQVTSRATGFFVTQDGWLLTNRHVTAGCRRVSVGNGTLSGLIADKVLYPGDLQVDLAAVHVALRAPAFLRFAITPWPSPASKSNTSEAEIVHDIRSTLSADGQAVFVIGFPGYDHGASPVHLRGELLGGATSIDRRHWFQSINAPIQPGSSGSPVIDSKGEVVGVVSRVNVTLPGKPSAAVVKQALETLPTSATQGLLEPAAIANTFVQAIDPTTDGQRQKAPADPDVVVVRVFCFR